MTLRLARFAVGLLLSFCLLADPLAAKADPSTSITIVVVDEKNQPVSQAVIELRRGEQAAATAGTDASGKARLAVPAPGAYSLSVSKQGYIANHTALTVTAGNAPGEIDLVLTRVELNQQSVNVSDTAPSPAAESSNAPTTLEPSQAKETPSKPATLVDTLPLIPGIVRAKDGTVRVAGYAEHHSTLLVNSVDVTDPATGMFGLSVPIDAVDTVSVSEMPYLAQYGRFTAGVVSAETKRGGDKWQFSLNDPLPEFRIRSAHLEGLKTATPRLNFSGPILANKIYFTEGAEYLLNKQEVITLPFPQNQTISTAINSFTQVDAILSSSQTLTVSYHFAPHSVQHAGLDFFNPEAVTPNVGYHESTGTVLDRMMLGGGVLQSTFAGIRVTTSTQPQGTAQMVLTPIGNQGNYFSQEVRRATRFEWLENWTPRTLHFAGEHTFQIGSVVSHSENEGDFSARPVLIEDAGGQLLQRIDFTGGTHFDLADTEPAVYAQDHWMLNSHFALDAGLRLEAQTITHSTRTAPRGGFVWTPDSTGKTVIRGGAGVFYDYVPLDVYAFGSYPQQTITTYGANGAVVGAPIQYINLTQQALQSHFPFIDRGNYTGNFAPYSVAGHIEVERQLGPLVTLRVKYLLSRAQDLISVQPDTVQGQNALVLGSGGWARTRQLEFTTRLGPGGNRQLYFSYVRQQARGNINDASSYVGDFPFPVVRQSLTASLPSEIPNRFLLWGTYALPYKFRAIPKIEYRNGFPYQPTDILQNYLPVGTGPQYRFPGYFSLDLRVSKDIQVTSKHAIRLSGTMLNFTNHFNPLEVHSNIADPQYGTFFGNYHRRFLLDFDFLF